MPTYEYQCSKCGKTIEIFQSINAPALTHCTTSDCKGTAPGEGEITRKISAGAGLIFNGSGFYLTDYKNNSSSSDSGSSTDAS
jgi:putative FmdB family regulatory protein